MIKEQKYFYFLSIISLSIIFYFYFKNDNFYITLREPQTAISSVYMTLNPMKYITPIMGYPWEIPMEFPIFQYIVFLLNFLPFNLEDIGKFISLISFIGCSIVIYRILMELNFKRSEIYLFLCLVITSPIYLTYSLSFTIEMISLLLALLYLYFFIKYYKQSVKSFFMLSIIFGCLAALSKGTTWAVFSVIIAIIIIYDFFQNFNRAKEFKKYILNSIYFISLLFLWYPIYSNSLWFWRNFIAVCWHIFKSFVRSDKSKIDE